MSLFGGLFELATLPIHVVGRVAQAVTEPIPVVGELTETVVKSEESLLGGVTEVLEEYLP